MRQRRGFVKISTLLVALIVGNISISVPSALAWDPQPTNPFPGVAYGAEIPGYTVSVACVGGDCGIGIVPVIDCPPWSAADGADGYTSGFAKRFCRNSWTPPTSTADDEDFRNRQALATAAAQLESQEYSDTHPGEQKCVTWGPVVHANGISTASGGVCANPVGVKPDGTTSQVPPTQSGAVAPSAPSNTETSTQTTPSVSPTIDLTLFGIGKPFTRVITGKVSTSDCPSGFQAAANFLDGIRTGGATECWPADAWAAYSVGGDTWSKFKGDNTSDTSKQVIAANIEVNKMKALALNKAQQESNLKIGTRICVTWVFQDLSGQECSYIPIQAGIVRNDSATSTSLPIDTNTISTITKSESVTVDSQQKFSGTVLQIKEAVYSVVQDSVTAKAINVAFQKMASLSKLVLKTSMKVPSDGSLDSTITNKTPKICSLTSTKITARKSGNCQIQYTITDDDENKFVLITSIKVKK
jgi:hypothetical protein